MATVIDPIRLVQMPQLKMQGGPAFSTQVIRTQSGWRQANQNWEYALWKMRIRYVRRVRGDFDEIIRFFLGRRGPEFPFLARDPADHRDDGVGKVLLVNGVYRLVKEYPDTVRPYRRVITKPYGTINILGVPGTLALNTSTGIVAGATGPGTWTGEFDVPVCFMGDPMDYDYSVADIAEWEAELEEVRIQ